MAESRLLPCNFWSWPAISPLLLEQKAILTYLWTCRFSTACGGFEFPTRLAAAELGLTDPVFCEALRQFKGLGLIDFDETTSEVFIVGWFRFHKFTTGPQVMNFLRSKNKINSPAIQKRVTEASVAARVPQSLKKGELSKNQGDKSQHQHQHQRQQNTDCAAVTAASAAMVMRADGFEETGETGAQVYLRNPKVKNVSAMSTGALTPPHGGGGRG